MIPDEYASLDATDLVRLVQAREVTPEELRVAATAMYERTHPQINAVLEWYDEPTPMPAEALDAALAGVPFLRKDYGSAEAGRLVEMGSRLAKGMRAAHTGEFIRRLQTAGVQILGRSAVPEFILHGTTESVVNGQTRNPFNPSLSAGGSSGGSAAAVAAGVVPVAHASDCAGSIRIPAAACGLVGLKPGRRRVPWEGGGWGGIAEEFVVTKSVRDSELFLSVLGRGPMVELSGPLRIAVSLDHWGGCEPDAEVVAATQSAAAALEAHGHRVTEIATPVDHQLVMGTWHAFFSRWVLRDAERASAETGHSIDADHVEFMGLQSIEAARGLTVADITAAQETQGLLSHDLASSMQAYDVLLTPTLGRASIPLGTVAGDVADIDTYMDEGDAVMPYNYLFNVTGWPAVSVPVGWAGVGVPLGVQLAAPIGHEPVLLKLARDLEDSGLFVSRGDGARGNEEGVNT